MCNPRRVTVTATRDIAEAWRREVSRTVQLVERVTGDRGEGAAPTSHSRTVKRKLWVSK